MLDEVFNFFSLFQNFMIVGLCEKLIFTKNELMI